jgi:cytosine/adenosine deaminase-related metal-dependent hydrolase
VEGRRQNEVIGTPGVSMPGNICAHTHFYGAFARGMAIPGAPPRDFPEILRRLWWPLDLALDAESIRLSVLPCLVDAIRHGTTTLFDHHASGNAIHGSLDVIARAVEQSGLRAVLLRVTCNVASMQAAWRPVAKAEPLISALFGSRRRGLSMIPRRAGRRARGSHIHAAEHEVDEADSLARSGTRTVERLRAHGILGPRTLVAHGVHFDAAEIETMRATGTWLSHQPRSNMNNGVGVAPIETMLAAGLKVCLGNDGLSNAMWEEWKAAYLLHKVHHRDPRRMNGMDLARIAITNNADLASTHFPDAALGRIEVGAAADLILVDYHPNTTVTGANLPWHIVFGLQPGMVTSTMVAGRLLMRDRVLLTLDEAQIAAQARELAPVVWARYSELASKAS